MDRIQKDADNGRTVAIVSDLVTLEGELAVPSNASAIVLFAHGSGSSRHSPRNRFVARALRDGGLATLLFDLLTPREERLDQYTGQFRFDIDLLARRLMGATDWVRGEADTRHLRVGYFGASTGAAAALIAAARRPKVVAAVVSRGGRPDLASSALPQVRAPTLLIVGANDAPVIALNEEALQNLHTIKRLALVAGATHLFEEAGALEEVAVLARDWFTRYLVLTENAPLDVADGGEQRDRDGKGKRSSAMVRRSGG
ncbi:MAG: dienelactone hydrolase family protein [Candidatus Limnocylindrales bacterium]